MDVVITGATGLIGRALSRSLLDDGHEVRQLVRPGSPPVAGARAVEWDPPRGVIDRAGLEGADAVVHLAGAGIADKRWNDERKRLILESRSIPTRLLAETLADLERPPGVLVSGSAIGYYGEAGDRVLTEESPPGEVFLSEVCVAWEEAAAPAADAGIRVARLRTGIVLDRHGGALAKLLPLFRFGLGGRLGSGKQWWSWISMDDQIGIIRWLLENDVSGPVNATAPEPLTNAAFTKVLGEVLHRPTVLPVPAFGPKVLLGGELAQQLLFLSQRVQPTVAENEGYTFAHPTLDDALRAVLAG